ncbi:MAG: hypothetical protein PHP18_05805, partial [Bacilli bacterium]|nr:hypothetical protein [Bacilli bacterium]
MTWTVTYYVGYTPYTDTIHDIVVDRKIQSLNQATIKTMLDIQIDTVVTLTKDETISSTWIVKKKTLEDDVVWKYELVEMMSELADQVVYEGLKVFDVAGQTIRSIVTECLTGSGWTIGDAGKLYVGVIEGNYTWLVSGGNTDLVNGGYIFNIGDTVRLSGTIPAPFDDATVYYVVAASSSSIQLSLTEGGSAITATATGQVVIDKCVKYMSVYWGKISAAVFKVVCDIGGMALWGENNDRKLCYGYNRSTMGDITSSVYKCVPVEESYKRGYDRVIVLGQTDSIKGEAGTGTKVVVYKYEDATTADEAKSLAEVILKDLGKVSVRKTLTVAPTMNIQEGYTIWYDGVKYFVFDVKETYEHIEIGIGAMLKTVFDKLGSKLKEVTGEVGTGTNSTYDGGLQNMGAPSVNCLISVDVDTDTILVPDVELYYSNTDRVVFTSPGTVPSPLVEGTVYYVRDVDATTETFKVAETSGGVAIDLTTNGSGLIRA